MKVTVFGVGYVGLTQGAVLSDVGHMVLCVDTDESKISKLQAGLVPIYEPGLTELVEKNQSAGRLYFSNSAAEGVAHGEVIFIAVGTPADEDGSADLKNVLAVAGDIAEYMAGFTIVVNKSTVPVGTADLVTKTIADGLTRRGAPHGFAVVSNPEFLKEGAALNDCMRPDRIVIGTGNGEAAETLKELYAPLVRSHDRFIFMDARSAELTKYAANCLLATKISFMNEMANLAELLGADIEMVRQGIGSDNRIGYHFIYPGCGYGGSCFPKDIKALIHTAEKARFEPRILKAVSEVNERQKATLFEKLSRIFEGRLSGRTFALWGLSFKPNTDDMREAPSRVLMEALWAAGARVQAYDPVAMKEAQRIYGLREELRLTGTKEEALKGADALVICTEWRDFRAPDFDVIKSTLKQPVIVDGRNLYEPKRMAKRGFVYCGVGRNNPC